MDSGSNQIEPSPKDIDRPGETYRIASLYLFDTCTHACGYCWLAESGKVLDSSQLEPFRDPAYIRRVTDFFRKRSSEREKWLVQVTGGEPLIMPNLDMFCERLFEVGNRMAFYTSLFVSRKQKAFQFLLEHGAPEVDYVMASFHPEAEPGEDEWFQKVRMLKEAGHHVFVRFVGHPSRLHQLDRLADRCQELDVCFYPTALLTRNYPRAYNERERRALAAHSSSLSQVILLAGGVDTRSSRCTAGSRNIGIHLPTGGITPCVTVKSPVLGNLHEDRLELLDGPIACPEAGVACLCDVHFQQGIVAGCDDSERFEQQKKGFVTPLELGEQAGIVRERGLKFSDETPGIGRVQDDRVLSYKRHALEERYRGVMAKLVRALYLGRIGR